MSLPITSFDDAEMIATLKQRLAETVAAAGLDSTKACLIESVVGAIMQHVTYRKFPWKIVKNALHISRNLTTNLCYIILEL